MTMVAARIRNVLVRELGAVAREVAAYPSDELLWREVPGLPNPGGTLALHLAGNLEHYVGAVLGGTGYVRDRDAEFATRGLTRAEVRARVEAAAAAVDRSLTSATGAQVEGEYPEMVAGQRVRTADFLVHLVSHLGYHLGQLDYHRRMVAPDTGGVGTISLAALPDYRSGLVID
ncbi:MAG TPA: DinB family protein [Longimicrobiales bacterium]|nr:DinB family protein [Longimicrobiales bacterium]